MEFVVRGSRKPNQKILKWLEGKYVRISYSDKFWDMDLYGAKSAVKVLEVTEGWIRVEYTRTKDNCLIQKETVIKLIDVNAVDGFEVEEEGKE